MTAAEPSVALRAAIEAVRREPNYAADDRISYFFGLRDACHLALSPDETERQNGTARIWARDLNAALAWGEQIRELRDIDDAIVAAYDSRIGTWAVVAALESAITKLESRMPGHKPEQELEPAEDRIRRAARAEYTKLAAAAPMATAAELEALRLAAERIARERVTAQYRTDERNGLRPLYKVESVDRWQTARRLPQREGRRAGNWSPDADCVLVLTYLHEHGRTAACAIASALGIRDERVTAALAKLKAHGKITVTGKGKNTRYLSNVDSLPNIRVGAPLSCRECNKKFKTPKALGQHFKDAHPSAHKAVQAWLAKEEERKRPHDFAMKKSDFERIIPGNALRSSPEPQSTPSGATKRRRNRS